MADQRQSGSQFRRRLHARHLAKRGYDAAVCEQPGHHAQRRSVRLALRADESLYELLDLFDAGGRWRARILRPRQC